MAPYKSRFVLAKDAERTSDDAKIGFRTGPFHGYPRNSVLVIHTPGAIPLIFQPLAIDQIAHLETRGMPEPKYSQGRPAIPRRSVCSSMKGAPKAGKPRTDRFAGCSVINVAPERSFYASSAKEIQAWTDHSNSVFRVDRLRPSCTVLQLRLRES